MTSRIVCFPIRQKTRTELLGEKLKLRSALLKTLKKIELALENLEEDIAALQVDDRLET